MRFPRKIAMVAAAVTIPVAGIAVASGVASAGSSVTGTGTVTCTKAKGTITFKPPLVTGGSAAETTTIKATLSGCTTGGGSNITKVKGGSVTATTTGTNDCSTVATSRPETLTTKWTSTPAANPTVTSFTGYQLNTSPPGFTLPGSGNSASGTGSFPGSDGGMSSTATVTVKGLSGTCALGGKKSLKKLTITAGNSFSG